VTVVWSSNQKMVETVKRNDRTYAYDASTYSRAIVDLPILWQGLAEIGNTQPSMTTTIESFSRDPIGFEPGIWNAYHYVANAPMRYVDPSGKTLIHVGVGGGVVITAVWIYRNDPPGSYDWLTWGEQRALGALKRGLTDGLYECDKGSPGASFSGMRDAIANCPIVGKYEAGGSSDGDDGTSLTYDPGWAWSTKVVLSNDFFRRLSKCSQYQTLMKECYQRAYLRDFDDTGLSDNRSNKNFESIECCTGCCGHVNSTKWPKGGKSCCPPPDPRPPLNCWTPKWH